MKVLVTGAAGFTGGWLASALAERGRDVRVFVRREADRVRMENRGFEVVVGDLRDSTSVARAMAGVDQVYHIAAAFRVAGQSDRYYRDINVGGTRAVLDAARKHGVARVVHCSTVGVHGDVGSNEADETAPFNPGDIYQQTKLEAELLATAAFANGLPGVVVRPGGIYGPGDTRFLKLFKGIHRRRFVMLGTGTVRYQLIYIDDLVRGLLSCGELPQAVGNTYILTGQPAITLNQFVGYIAAAVGVPRPRFRLPLWPVRVAAYACEAICRPLGLRPPIYPRRVDFFCKERAFRTDKAEKELGFRAQVGPEEGIVRTARWYFENGYLRKRSYDQADVKGP